MQHREPEQDEFGDLVGWRVSKTMPAAAPPSTVFRGEFFSMHPIDADAQAAALFTAATASHSAERIWTYMPYGPFSTPDELHRHMAVCARSHDPLFFTILDNHTSAPVGMVSFLNIATASLSIELGHIWYVPQMHHSKANTEVCYLMLSAAFDQLGYRRVEWKCNSLNLRSRGAAQRLGFSFEGVFRQHLVVKGRNRDTAWLSLLDHEWPAVRANMMRWLYGPASDGPTLSLAELNRPLLQAVDPAL